MATSHDDVEGEEDEYVVLDLDSVSAQVHIPPNAPYVLSVRRLNLQKFHL